MMENVKLQIKNLIDSFQRDENKYCSASSGYTETEARVEFIDPFFKILGWDMSNEQGLANSLKDVVREESCNIESTIKRPDYSFRIHAERKFFIEAKKPSVDIKASKDSAIQVRSYGWTSSVPVSILTNFKTIRVYDTTIPPQESDNVNVALLFEYDYQNYLHDFDEIKSIFGRNAVANGSIEDKFKTATPGSIQINSYFLDKINLWRLQLAQDIYSRHSKLLNSEILNDITQTLINRMIFIRMCEDRGIENKERLLSVAKSKDYIQLQQLFKNLDDRYDTGLFAINDDPMQKNISLDSHLFLDIIKELYYPKAPYNFSVLTADFLGQIYEHFLMKQLVIDERTNSLSLVDKPVYQNRDIVVTPQPLVDEIVHRTLTGYFNSVNEIQSIDDITKLNVLDIAVGSGRFLLKCIDIIIDYVISFCLKNNIGGLVYKVSEGDFRLSFNVKRKIVESCLYGIDIDYNAVEIARFSMLIKLLEDENSSTLPDGKHILPNLNNNVIWGNSVVDTDFVAPDDANIRITIPMNWRIKGLPETVDIVVGNPPYLKTEEMVRLNKPEYNYFKNKYKSPHKQFDKYFIFIERAISHLSKNAWVGMIVPNKWMTIEAGTKLRNIFASKGLVMEIVDFGNELVFAGKSTYVCMLILTKKDHDIFLYKKLDSYETWRAAPKDKGLKLPYNIIKQLGSSPWILPANNEEAQKLYALYKNSVKMSEIATIFNGLQTSAEPIYSITEWEDCGDKISFIKDNIKWTIEKTITKPYLLNSGRVKSYTIIEADGLIIYPYQQDASGRTRCIPLVELKKHFPLAYRYFEQHKEKLSNRKMSAPASSDEYYRYGRTQALYTSFSYPKILYTVNQLGDKYGIDVTGTGFASGGTAGEVAIINPVQGYSLEFIMALLNQPLAEFFMHKRGSPFRGGYFSRGSAVIADLPVPKLDFNNTSQHRLHQEVTNNTKKIISIEKQISTAIGRSKDRLLDLKKQLIAENQNLFNKLWGM